MRHPDNTFNMEVLDEPDFLGCTFNDIRPEDIPAVIQTFNDWLDNAGQFNDRVTKIEFDGCEDINIHATHKTVQACSDTMMQDIINELII